MDRHLMDALVAALADAVNTPEQSPLADLPEYLTTEQAAVLNLTKRGLEGMRLKGTGPRWVKHGGRVRYRRGDLVGEMTDGQGSCRSYVVTAETDTNLTAIVRTPTEAPRS